VSSEALSWAFKQNVKPSAAKFVLVAMAECAHYQTGKVFPSIKHLEEITGLNRKTIISSVQALEDLGFIKATGERAGKTGQIKVYSLAVGTVPKPEQSQKRNSTVFSVKQSQKRDAEPSMEPSTPLVSSNEDTPPKSENDGLKPEHVVEVWNDLADRRGLPRVKVLTPTRLKQVKARIKSSSLDDFTEAIGAIERSSFLLGENDRGFRADFDFFLQPKSFTRLIEGFYG